MDNDGGQKYWVVDLTDKTVVTINSKNGTLEGLLLGRSGQRGCEILGTCNGSGSICRANRLDASLTLQLAKDFLNNLRPTGEYGRLVDDILRGQSHFGVDVYTWKATDSTTRAVTIDSYVGDILTYNLEHAVRESVRNVSRETAHDIALQAAQRQHAKYFTDQSAVVSIESSRQTLVTNNAEEGTPLWHIAIKVRCNCSEPVHEKFLEYYVNATTGELDKSSSGIIK